MPVEFNEGTILLLSLPDLRFNGQSTYFYPLRARVIPLSYIAKDPNGLGNFNMVLLPRVPL